LPVCLTKYYVMKAYWGVDIQNHALLISACYTVSYKFGSNATTEVLK